MSLIPEKRPSLPIGSGFFVSKNQNDMDGLQRCTRYAFGPNRLHLCGPDANKEVLSYITEQDPNRGLIDLLKQFKTMFPYLKEIATANKIADPFDDRVVEAYWLGNNLLENIGKKNFYRHLTENLQIKKRIRASDFEKIAEKLSAGAKMHHSFHVYNLWRMGNDYHKDGSFEEVDKCRISWGKIKTISGPTIIIDTQPLIYDKKNGFIFGPPVEKAVIRKLNDDIMIEAAVGDTISVHWDMPCEILTDPQVKNLKKYTEISLQLANKFLI